METRLFLFLLLPIFHVRGLPWTGGETENIRREVSKYKHFADKIIQLSVHGASRRQSYNRLAEMVDKFGPRPAGSIVLENTIDYMLRKLEKDGLENVHGEEVQVPHWVRGRESSTMLYPRVQTLSMLGLGGSVGTSADGITAEVLVVRSFEELQYKANKAAGKIVVYNQVWVDYGTSVVYRRKGAVEAAKVGAVASLIRSVTQFSIYSPHTGQQDYQNNVTKIPTACITVEDAEMLQRMSDREQRIVIEIRMEAKTLPPVKSRNVVAEIRGREKPEEVVLVSGHLDSWDVGQGAMDDGGGAMISWQALSLIRQLGLRPRRTMRVVLWTAEEEGALGGNQYFRRHHRDISNFDLVMESDVGTFTPTGIHFTGNGKSKRILREVMKLLKSINATLVTENVSGEDIAQWKKHGVPSASLALEKNNYFFFHHTNGDTMTVQNTHQMDLCSAVWAVVSYVVADLHCMLPRD